MKSLPKIYPADEMARKALFEYICAEYPRAYAQTLGRSILNLPIDLYRMGNGDKHILIVGAHHGSEHISASFIYSFMLSLLSADRREGAYQGINTEEYFGKYTLWTVPAVNPDGIEISLYGATEGILQERQIRMIGGGDHRRWQANARGVDLNHNYPFGFYEYKRIERENGTEPGFTLYSGESPLSEPETRAISSLVNIVNPSLVVSLHTQGEEIYAYPPCDTVSRLSEYMKDALGYKISSPEGTARYGGLCDFTAGELGIPSLTLEVGRGENPIDESELLRCEERLSRALFFLPTLL